MKRQLLRSLQKRGEAAKCVEFSLERENWGIGKKKGVNCTAGGESIVQCSAQWCSVSSSAQQRERLGSEVKSVKVQYNAAKVKRNAAKVQCNPIKVQCNAVVHSASSSGKGAAGE